MITTKYTTIMITLALLIGGIGMYLMTRRESEKSFWDRYGLYIMAVMLCAWVEYNYHYNPNVLYERAMALEARQKHDKARQILTQLAEEEHFAKAEVTLAALTKAAPAPTKTAPAPTMAAPAPTKTTKTTPHEDEE